MSIPSAITTYGKIEQKVRRLTASSSASTLSPNDIAQAVNTFYSQDFPYGIKIDQMRSVYRFFTEPYRDRYPIDVNYNQGIRQPVYIDGIRGSYYKEREQFYNVWTRFPYFSKPAAGDGTTVNFNFTIPGPLLTKEVVIGTVDVNGNPVSINDDGNGNLQMLQPNPVTSVPVNTTNPAVPGMYNLNTLNPGLLNPTNIGSVNYVTGQITINYPVAFTPAAGEYINVWVVQYQPGRPSAVLFWNNEFHVRPIPKLIHKIEVETYLTPVQFMNENDVPILNQWWQYIAYGAAMEILREREDFEGVEGLREGFNRQEALALERQAIEEIQQPNVTLFNTSLPTSGGVNGVGYY